MARKILTLAEVSEMTRVPLNTLRYWRARDLGPRTFKIGRNVVAYEDDCRAWLERQYETTSTKSA